MNSQQSRNPVRPTGFSHLKTRGWGPGTLVREPEGGAQVSWYAEPEGTVTLVKFS